MKKIIFIMSVFLISVFNISCTEHAANNAVLKRYLDYQAQTSMPELFGETYSKSNSQVVPHHKLRKVLQQLNVDIDDLPDRVKNALKDKNTVGLLVSKTRPVGDKVPKMLSDTQRLLLTWEMSRIEFEESADLSGGFWASDAPCKCADCKEHEYCGGCKGKSCLGTYSVCVCTYGCRDRACPKCDATDCPDSGSSGSGGAFSDYIY